VNFKSEIPDKTPRTGIKYGHTDTRGVFGYGQKNNNK
jgi:hypothetical protein